MCRHEPENVQRFVILLHHDPYDPGSDTRSHWNGGARFRRVADGVNGTAQNDCDCDSTLRNRGRTYRYRCGRGWIELGSAPRDPWHLFRCRWIARHDGCDYLSKTPGRHDPG